MSGSNSRTGTTLFDFTLLQPLLRNAGRDLILERLTQSERNLLANVRAFERFRRTFYLRITIGRGTETLAVNNISLNSNLQGGAGGYLGLLQAQLVIRNQQENIARQTENLLILNDTLIEMLTTIPDNAETIVRQHLQVAQNQQNVISAQSSLVTQQANYQRSVDQFMRDMGLPPYICAKLDDPILEQFELIDSELLTRRKDLGVLRSNVGNLNVAILKRGEPIVDPATDLPRTQIQWTPELAQLLKSLQQELQPLAEFNRELIETDLPSVAEDINAFERILPRRQRQNESLKSLYRTEQESICALVGVSNIDESIFELKELDDLSTKLRESFTKLEERLRSYQSRIEALEKTMSGFASGRPQEIDPVKLTDLLRDDVILASQKLLAELGDDVLALQLIQARARTESVLLPEVDIDPPAAFEIARKNRRDWANVRAALVDSWRQIEVVADQLESTLDVELSGDVRTVSESPVNLSGNSSSLRAGLRWDAPITRLQERNDYAAALIRFDRNRRNYYTYEDGIWQLLRAEIRQLRANRFNFELGRQAVRIAASQIDLNADIRTLNEARGTSVGPTAARDAIGALNDLLNAQNGLLSIFVNYEVVRRGLELDLGTMELTPEGMWLDPGAIVPQELLSLPGTTVDGLIEFGCNDCGLRYNPLPPEPVFGDFMHHSEHAPSHADGPRMSDGPLQPFDELPPPVEQQELPPPVEQQELPPPVEQQDLPPPVEQQTLPPPVANQPLPAPNLAPPNLTPPNGISPPEDPLLPLPEGDHRLPQPQPL